MRQAMDNKQQEQSCSDESSSLTPNLTDDRECLSSVDHLTEGDQEISLPSNNNLPAREAFVVQCEREEINIDCIAVLKRHGVRPIILNHSDESRSLKEIFIQHSNTAFAVIILAGDDFIYDRLKGKPKDALLTPKADTVFHLGYLSAMFANREQKSFRFPTGLQNAAFIPYKKNGSWENILESKLKESRII